MTAAKDYPKGHLVGVYEPFVHSLRSEYHGQYCSQCFTPHMTGMKRCTGCSKVIYCDSVCQRKNWKLHKCECTLIKRAMRNPSSIPGDTALFIYKLYSYSKSNKGKAIKENFEGVERSYDSLMSHVDEIKQDAHKMSMFQELRIKLNIFRNNNNNNNNSINSNKKNEDTNVNEELNLTLLLEAFGKVTINSFFITDSNHQEIGMGIYLGPSLLDHSCDYNTVWVYKGISLKLRTVIDIKANQKLNPTYVDIMRSTRDRQTELQRTYYFKCTCAFCQDDLRDKEMGEYSNVGGNVLEPLELKAVLKQISSNFLNPDYCTSKKLLDGWKDRFGRWNINLYCLLVSCMNSYAMVQKLKEAVSFGKRVTDIYDHYLPNPHPNYIMHLLGLAKINLYLSRKTVALEILKKAKPLINMLYEQEDHLTKTFQELFAQSI